MIDVSVAKNENERLALELIRAMELGTLPETVKAICTDDFVWANSGFETINGQDELWAQMERGGFASEVPILKDMTHFSADLINMASEGDIVFTERVDHHWAEDGRDLMTPHICGVTEIRNGKISAFRDFFDVACFQQEPTEVDPNFTLAAYQSAQAEQKQ